MGLPGGLGHGPPWGGAGPWPPQAQTSEVAVPGPCDRMRKIPGPKSTIGVCQIPSSSKIIKVDCAYLLGGFHWAPSLYFL